jgi:lactate racemase
VEHSQPIHIAYGRHGLTIRVPTAWNPVVVRSAGEPALPDAPTAIAAAIRNPIGCTSLATIAERAVRDAHAVGRDARAGIVFNDITRATPNELIIAPVIEELLRAGIRERRITLFNATGTHRPNTRIELDSILGADLAGCFRVVQNECEAAGAYTHVGTTRAGNEVRVLSEYVRQDVRIATGFIEPHFFAGYSGGGKAVVPGLAHLTTILANHGARHMDHPDATWGKTTGNPLWEDLAEAASFADPVFLVNVTLDSAKNVTGVYAGDRTAAHEAGCREVARHAIVPVDHAFDIVVTSNSGHPLDLNLYQAVKGMSAAGRIVRDGGEIIIAAECWDGLPSHGLFADLVRGAESAGALLKRLRTEEYRRDAWQAHIFALLRSKARITLVSDGIDPAELPHALCELAATVESALQSAALRVGRTPSVCIMPDGPLTIPVLRGQ